MQDTRPWDLVRNNIFNPEFSADPRELADSMRSFMCSQQCPECLLTQYTAKKQEEPQFSYRCRLTPEQAETICAGHLSKIKEHRAHLCEVLSRNADNIISRWSKKGRFGTQQKREDLIKTVAPDMAPHDNFVVDWFYSTDRLQVLSRKASDRFKLMHSWLSVDLLKSNPDALFALLHNRTAFSPDAWVDQEAQHIYPRFHQGDLDVDWADRMVVTHDKEKFGTLIRMNYKDLHQKYAMAYPAGSLILEAQATLLGTLRNMVDKILEGLDTTKPGRTEKWRAMTSPANFQALGGIEGWAWLSHGALCAPVRSLELDLQELLTTVKIRRERAEDYLLSVQGDASSFSAAIESVIRRLDMTQSSSDEAAGRLLCMQMEIAAHRYTSFRVLETELARIAAIQRPVGPFGPIIEFQEPPGYADFDQAVQGLKHLLLETLEQRIADLQVLFALSPALKGCWTLDQRALRQINRQAICSERAGTSVQIMRSNFLEWFVCMVARPPNEWEDVGHRNLASLFEAFLRNDTVPKEQKARIDDHEYRVICDIVTLFELLQRVIHTHHPLVLRPSMRLPDANFGIRGPRRITMLRRMLYIFDGLRVVPSEPAHSAGSRACQYRQEPTGYTGHTLGTLCVQTSQHLHLLAQRLGGAPGSERAIASVRQTLIGNRSYFWRVISLHVLDEYARAAVTDLEKKEYFDMTHPEHCVSLATQAMDELDRQRRERDQHFLEFRHHGPSSSSSSSSSSLRSRRRPASLEPLVVSQQHYNEVFAAMYPQTDSERHRGTNWLVFMQAMRALGFQVVLCAGGLEVELRHETFGDLAVYKPLASGKIGAGDLQIWGKRFAHRFHWNRERFVPGTAAQQAESAAARNSGKAMSDEEWEAQLIFEEFLMNDVD